MKSLTQTLTAAALALLVLAGFAQTSLADPPNLIQYQAVLADDDGNPIDGNVNLVFRIFSAAGGGTALWTETHNGVAVDNGVFHVVLGSITPLDSALFAGGDRYLETAVDGSTLSPRRQFLSTPYALRAAVADVALSGGDDDDDWTISGSNVYRMSGNVGIGEDGPLSKLHIETGDLGIDADDVGVNTDILVESADANITLLSNTAGGTGSGVGLSEVSGGSVVNTWAMRRQTTGAGGALQFTHTDAPNAVNFLPSGNVGIGTINPAAKLEVNGDFKASNVEAGTVAGTTLQGNKVVAANSLGSAGTPDVGGTYADNVTYAWGQIRGDGVIESSYGIESVTRLGTGWYRITYKRNLPNGVVPVVTAYSANDVVNCRVSFNSSTRCEVRTALFVSGNPGGFQSSDYRFLIQVTGRP